MAGPWPWLTAESALPMMMEWQAPTPALRHVSWSKGEPSKW